MRLSYLQGRPIWSSTSKRVATLQSSSTSGHRAFQLTATKAPLEEMRCNLADGGSLSLQTHLWSLFVRVTAQLEVRQSRRDWVR